jgi:hypothetical protein
VLFHWGKEYQKKISFFKSSIFVTKQLLHLTLSNSKTREIKKKVLPIYYAVIQGSTFKRDYSREKVMIFAFKKKLNQVKMLSIM